MNLPKKKTPGGAATDHYVTGYNACLDEVKDLMDMEPATPYMNRITRHLTTEEDAAFLQLIAQRRESDPKRSLFNEIKEGFDYLEAERTFQKMVQPWMLECFGPEIAADKKERNHRFFEESLELVQACEMTQEEVIQLVDYVYGRPVGEKHQEVGGVMITLAALCLAQGLDMHAEGETELARIWTKVPQIRAKQAGKPKHSPLPESPTIKCWVCSGTGVEFDDCNKQTICSGCQGTGRQESAQPTAFDDGGVDAMFGDLLAKDFSGALPAQPADIESDPEAIIDKVGDLVGTSAFDEVSPVELVAAFRKVLAMPSAQQPADPLSDEIEKKLTYITACAQTWEGTDISRCKSIMRTTVEISALLAQGAPANEKSTADYALSSALLQMKGLYALMIKYKVPHAEAANSAAHVESSIRTLHRIASAPVQADAQDADMFWNDDDPETCGECIQEIIDREYGDGTVRIGDTMTIQQAIRLQNIQVRVIAAKDDPDSWDYEIIDAAKGAQGGGK